MSQNRTFEIPIDLADRLEAAAKAMGLTLPEYIHFLQSYHNRGLD